MTRAVVAMMNETMLMMNPAIFMESTSFLFLYYIMIQAEFQLKEVN